MSENFKELSRKRWSGNSTVENINCGSLQRIADASELMAKNWDNLIHDRDYYKKQSDLDRVYIKKLERGNAALRGHIKRIKRAKK